MNFKCPEILADEEAIETSVRPQTGLHATRRPEILADEEAIETEQTQYSRRQCWCVLRYSLTKKRLRHLGAPSHDLRFTGVLRYSLTKKRLRLELLTQNLDAGSEVLRYSLTKKRLRHSNASRY